MKIVNSNINMSSQHTLVKEYRQQSSIRYWQNGSTESGLKDIGEAIQDQLQISDEAKEALEQKNQEMIQELTQCKPVELELTDEEHFKVDLLEKLLSVLLGKKIKIQIPRRFELDQQQQPVVILPENSPASQIRLGQGFAFNYQERYYESEKLSFDTEGKVQTADGRVIDFQISLKMSREFFRQSNIQVRTGAARLCDPLVINYEGIPSGLTNTKFSFDIDCDGVLDQISFTNPGSGFLAIDLNNDGKINDGSELFGPRTGNGFGELAEYDLDQNGWIDENDPIFERLRIWTKDQNGKDQLFALGQKGVGAIYLGNVAAEFGLKNDQNQLLGQAQTAGVFLREDGSPGIVQQIDLVV